MRTINLRSMILGLLLCSLVPVGSLVAEEPTASDPSPGELFDQRILPIFRSPKPSSCVQCHLSSVDLKNYILPSAEKTFRSLRDQGLIDVEQPRQSKILTLIGMGNKDPDQGARLIHEKMREAEYRAFECWIVACANNPEWRNLPPLKPTEIRTPERPVEVIRHTRKSRLADSFARKIWSQRMRCFPCHTPHEIDPANPRQAAAVKTRQKLVEQWGEEAVAEFSFFKKTPEETMAYLIQRSQQAKPDELPMLNLDNPLQSLIVRKPLSKLPAKQADGTFAAPSSKEPVTHMGGLKMHPDDQSYKAFISWIEDYARSVDGSYISVEDLPPDNWRGTQKVLRVSQLPETWEVGLPVQLFVHVWDDSHNAWSERPIAFTQGTVTPRQMINGALFELLNDDDADYGESQTEEEPTLTGGRYLIKVYPDHRGRLKEEPSLLLGEQDFAGQLEFSKSRWRDGFKQAPMISAAELQKQ
ncbi:MAG: hypothetical protein HUJ26_10960 [Planctomycetaceae bacterium]|nr:hypothetical protein [Planctomycetaceae bacterium]